MSKSDRSEKEFDRAAAGYDDWVRMALPTYDELFTVAVEAIPYGPEEAISFADLGAGTGLFSAMVLARYRQARATLFDTSKNMLEIARRRFVHESERVQLVRERLEDFRDTQQFDLVVSSLAIHHLQDQDKRVLFSRIHTCLAAGGAFINVDQIRGVGPFDALYWRTWKNRIRQNGAPEDKIQDSIRRRREVDRDSTLVEQLKWLEDAGFRTDCVYKHYFVGVFLAVK